MTCDEFERVLPELEGGHSLEQNEHLKTCPSCLELVSELNAIVQEARVLAFEEDEPSPRVWNSIEIALQQEGLIREPQPVRVQIASRRPAWKLAWLVPAFSALFVALGLLVYQNGGRPAQIGREHSVPTTLEVASQANSAEGLDEEQLVNLVATRSPAMRDSFASNLRAVDTYIHDAEASARSNPNDEIAQRYLINAYEQRAMVYEMALNRSLP